MAFLRKQQGITQKQLAERAGVSLRTITNYETGGRLPKQKETYTYLAKALNVDENYLKLESDGLIAFASELMDEKFIREAMRLMPDIACLTGGILSLNDQGEMMRAIKEAFLMACEILGVNTRIGEFVLLLVLSDLEAKWS